MLATPEGHPALRSVHGSRADVRDETRQGPGHSIGRLFLKKVGALDHDGLLVGPGAAELALRANQKAARIRIDEELRYRAGGEPPRVVLDNRYDVGRLAGDWQIPRPGQHRHARSAGVAIVAPVDVDCLLRDVSQRQEI